VRDAPALADLAPLSASWLEARLRAAANARELTSEAIPETMPLPGGGRCPPGTPSMTVSAPG
jgi:hypothetical protein